MNARQTKKRLKKHIDRLQSDNDLMRRIISNSQEMQEIYDLYNSPVFHTVTNMHFQEYRAKKVFPPDAPVDSVSISWLKEEVTRDLVTGLKDHITYELDAECMTPTITASIFVGRK